MKKFQDKIKNDGKNKNDLKEKFLEVEIFFLLCFYVCEDRILEKCLKFEDYFLSLDDNRLSRKFLIF